MTSVPKFKSFIFCSAKKFFSFFLLSFRTTYSFFHLIYIFFFLHYLHFFHTIYIFQSICNSFLLTITSSIILFVHVLTSECTIIHITKSMSFSTKRSFFSGLGCYLHNENFRDILFLIIGNLCCTIHATNVQSPYVTVVPCRSLYQYLSVNTA